MAINVTSPEPRARDGTLGTLPMPIFRACATVFAMPTSSSMRTAARLLDVRNADRTVIADPAECPSSGIHAPCSV